MAQLCTVCRCLKVDEVNAALIQSVPVRTIAGQYSLSKSALIRHRAQHLPLSLSLAKKAGEVASADDLLGQARSLLARSSAMLDRLHAEGKSDSYFRGVTAVTRLFELLAKLTGEMKDRDTGPRTVQVVYINRPSIQPAYGDRSINIAESRNGGLRHGKLRGDITEAHATFTEIENLPAIRDDARPPESFTLTPGAVEARERSFGKPDALLLGNGGKNA